MLHNWLHYLWAKKTEPTEQDVRQNSDLVWMLWRDKTSWLCWKPKPSILVIQPAAWSLYQLDYHKCWMDENVWTIQNKQSPVWFHTLYLQRWIKHIIVFFLTCWFWKSLCHAWYKKMWKQKLLHTTIYPTTIKSASCCLLQHVWIYNLSCKH